MILNSAIIERYLIDGKTYEDTKEFIDALLACDDLVADVYVNYKRVASGPLSLSVNNSWIIANVDERMSITNMDGSAYVINIVVHQLGCDELEDVIMRSTSPLSTFIDPGDIDADLYFSVMATVPECTQECHVPESEFNMMGTNNIVPKDFTDDEQCPDDPTMPEPEPGDPGIIEELFKTNMTYAYDTNDREHSVVFGVDFDVPDNIKNNIISNFGKYGMYLQISGEQGDYTFDVGGNLIQDMAHINVHVDSVSDISNVVMVVYPQNGGEQIGTATAILREYVWEDEQELYPKVTEKNWYVDAKSLGILDLQLAEQN